MLDTTLYFVTKIDLDGAAFEDGQGAEPARILREPADKAEDQVISTSPYTSVRDENGNVVGHYAIKLGFDLST